MAVKLLPGFSANAFKIYKFIFHGPIVARIRFQVKYLVNAFWKCYN